MRRDAIKHHLDASDLDARQVTTSWGVPKLAERHGPPCSSDRRILPSKITLSLAIQVCTSILRIPVNSAARLCIAKRAGARESARQPRSTYSSGLPLMASEKSPGPRSVTRPGARIRAEATQQMPVIKWLQYRSGRARLPAFIASAMSPAPISTLPRREDLGGRHTARILVIAPAMPRTECKRASL